MPSRTDTVGHTKAFDYPVMDHRLGGGGSQSASARGRFELPTYRSTVEHTNHQTTMSAPGSNNQKMTLKGSEEDKAVNLDRVLIKCAENG